MVDRRAEILRAAAHRIARDGVRGLRVTDVAEEAGVSPGLLYYHFTDRSGLLAATLEHINAHADQVRARGRHDADSPAEELERRLLSELDEDTEVRENSAAWNELRALAVFEPDLQGPMRRTTETWVEEVAGSVAAVRGWGDGRRTAVILTALVEGLSSRWLAGGLSLDEAHSLLAEAAGRLAPAARTEPAHQETP